MDSNQAREQRVQLAVEAYSKAVPPVWPQSEQEVLTDLLTDLRHYCAVYRLDFKQAVRLSQMHFRIEKHESEATESGLL